MKSIAEKIAELKKKKNAIILAHYYQEPDIQDSADFVGDSLGLAIRAADTKADIIVFAGVHFMAETAKILNPGKKVILPDLNAGCSLSESCNGSDFAEFRKQHPAHYAVTYINCSAEVKAASDIICTSSNALDIVKAAPADRPVLFSPDRNMGKYIQKVTGRELLLWDGSCIVHEVFSKEKLLALKRQHSDALIVAHPESETAILEMADFIGSSTAMINFVEKSDSGKFIIATEAGILHKMSERVKGKILIPAPGHENNACACSECPYMKMNTMEKLYSALRDETPEIILEEELIEKALTPLKRMLEFS